MHTTVTIDWTLTIAIYAAVVATFTLLWDWWKWLHAGPSLVVTGQANMKSYGMPAFEGKSVMVVNATNRGDRPTTITHFTIHQYPSWWAWMRKRAPFNAIVNVANDMRPPPYVLPAGGTWTAPCLQDDEMVNLANTGRLYLSITHSHSTKPVFVRVFPDSKEE